MLNYTPLANYREIAYYIEEKTQKRDKMLTDAQAAVERRQFFERFQQEHGETVKSVELAELRGSTTVYRELGLEVQSGKSALIGLLVFCTDSTFFYLPPSENYFSAIIRKAAHAKEPVEQTVNLSGLSGLKFSLPRRSFFSFLSSGFKRTICAAFTSRTDSPMYFEFILNKKAEKVLPLLSRQ